MNGIWIRSQNKRRLIKCDNFRIFENMIDTEINGCGFELGTYSTEEKALKVLDMIVDMISRYECHGIFQMPQDDDYDDYDDYEV